MPEATTEPTDVMTVRIPIPQKQRLKARAVDLDRSVAWCIRTGIDLFLDSTDGPDATPVAGRAKRVFGREVSPNFRKGKS